MSIGEGHTWETGGTRRRRRPVAAVAAMPLAGLLVAVVLVAGVALLARGDTDPREGSGIPLDTGGPQVAGESGPPGPESLAPERTATQPPAPDPSPPVAAGAWESLGDAPVAIPAEHHAVWTGGEFVVFGHRGETAAYDVRSGRWDVLPTGPLVPATAPSPLWTGSEVLVWGRRAEGPPGRLAVAAYDLAAGRWREAAAGPLPVITTGVAVWTGRQALVWGALASGSKVTAAYDPAADAWTSLPQAPVPLAAGATGIWTGEEMVIWGERVGFGGAPFAAAYGPAGRSWRRLPNPPLRRPSEAAAVWTGRDLLLSAGPGVAGAALRLGEPETAWRALTPAPPGPHPPVQQGLAAAWTGEHMAMAGTLTGGTGWLYDPATERWQLLPAHGGGRLHPAMAWTGEALLVWGGYTTTGPSVELFAWRPRAGHETVR